MEAWHRRLTSQRQDLLNYDEERNLFLGVMIESLREVYEGTKARSSGRSMP